MKIIRNKYIPFPGYKAINLFGVLFVKNNAKIDEVTINHESIHSRQFYEMTAVGFVLAILLFPLSWIFLLFVPLFFYIVYVLEWLIRLPKGNAYRNISFEREAYANENYSDYLSGRKLFAFLDYL